MCEVNALDKLALNAEDTFKEAANTLIRIGKNIIKNPNNLNYRSLRKHNVVISRKVLAINGGIECLKLMGFVENEKGFVMPATYPASNIQSFCQLIELKIEDTHKKVVDHNLSTITESSIITNGPVLSEENRYFKRIVLPPLKHLFLNPFLQRIESLFHNTLTYENKEVQEFAKSLIPLESLEIEAQNNLRLIQMKIKKEKLEDPEYSIQDMLILGLLSWFKNDFFKWVDSPNCDYCDGKTVMSHMSTNPNDLLYTDRVEVHRCQVCHQFTNFPRYNDLNILLHTRKGRCGEWANTFTLFCRALGWDTRYIHDETDHVWTEVYSVGRKRWIHCDPCENSCDSPLIYEIGWKKKLSYIIAYSVDEVQDVTWRYSSNHQELLKRRKNCSEGELINALITLRKNRQENYSELKKNYLRRRLLSELVELMVEKKSNENEQIGRLSGSLEWRTTRGEVHGTDLYIWKILDEHMINNSLIIKYSAALDNYVFDLGTMSSVIKDWTSGVLNYSNIFRKEEKDWKIVYLSRKEGAEVGIITWKYELVSEIKVIDKISLKFHSQTFQNGVVDVQICAEGICLDFPKDKEIFETESLSGHKSFLIVVKLSGGTGAVAWQHAQLFRQVSNSEEYPFEVQLVFKNK